MLLCYEELLELVGRGVLKGVPKEHINGSSIDITLGSLILVEGPSNGKEVDLRRRVNPNWVPLEMGEDGYLISPGELVLGSSQEWFDMPPTLSSTLSMKSSPCRMGLNHLLAGWIDPGFTGSVLTLELQNSLRYHGIRIRPGDRIAQVSFLSHLPVPQEALYTQVGRYNWDTKVTPAKV